MGHTRRSPIFATRQETAEQLMLSPRQIDRLVARGKLDKVVVSDNRAGITRDSLAAYIASRANSPLADDQLATGSACIFIFYKLPAPHPMAAAVIDNELGEVFPAIMVAACGTTEIAVCWPKRIGYDPAAVKRAIKSLEAGALLHC